MNVIIKKSFLGVFLIALNASFVFLSCASNQNQVANDIEKKEVSIKEMVQVYETKSFGLDKQVRIVSKATLSALDFSAYNDNPIRLAGKEEKPENYVGKLAQISLSEFPFPMLQSISNDKPSVLGGVEPIAWEPFTKILYTQLGVDTLSKIINSIEAVKWDEPEVFRAFQTVTSLWGVQKGESLEWFVEVTPAKWTNRAPFYGKLDYSSTGETIEVLNYYLSYELNDEEAFNWIRTLSSYWYPTLNTDLEQHICGTNWPDNSQYKPFAVMRGNPMGTPIWIAFDVLKFRLSDEQIQAKKRNDSLANLGEVIPVNRTLDTSSTFRLETLSSMENTCLENEETLKFREKLTQQLNALPKEQNAWSTKSQEDNFLWFRRNANYLLAGKISSQDSLHNPLPRMIELKEYLDSLNIQLLVVPVPVKEEIYADKLVQGTSSDLCVNVNGRAFIQEMLMAGIDVLDLYPVLKSAKMGDEPPNYSYQRYDTHWALPGMLAAMELLASRVTQYSWYNESNKTPNSLTIKDTVVLREGDLVSHLSDLEKSKYLADTLLAMKVYKGNTPYKGSKNAPILLMGDSFTGVFESVDQKSGGPGSLLAYATGLDVQVATSWGGGPGVRSRMMKMKNDMQSKRLVIYMMTARDFWQSTMEWDSIR